MAESQPQGQLTAAEKEKVWTFVQSKPGWPHRCPICASLEWILADHIVQPTTVSGSPRGVILGGLGYPSILLISPCGYTLQFNAVILGVSEPKKEGG